MPSVLVSLAATLPSGSGHGWIGSWSPGIGDPTFVGWFTVAAYFAAALTCWRVRAGSPDADTNVRRRERVFWTVLTAALLFLCMNKQLDLQTALTESMRIVAKRQGWYDDRFAYQRAFIMAMAAGALVGTWLCLRLTARLAASVRIAGVGLVLIGAFVLIRAASFHHVDELLGQTVLMLKSNWVLELTGIGVVLAGAWQRLRQIRTAETRKIGSSEMRA
jgi:hypothetical protein